MFRMHEGLQFGGRFGGGAGLGRFMGGFGGDGSGFRSGRKLGGEALQLLLLALLAKKPSHGYELIKTLEELSGGFYRPSPGMIYPALTYLEEIGYVSVETEGAKKLYRPTTEGLAHLESRLPEADEILAQLERVGRRMGDVRRAFAGGEEEEGWSDDLRRIRRALRRALREKRHASPDEQRRIAEILRRAVEEIGAKEG